MRLIAVGWRSRYSNRNSSRLVVFIRSMVPSGRDCAPLDDAPTAAGRREPCRVVEEADELDELEAWEEWDMWLPWRPILLGCSSTSSLGALRGSSASTIRCEDSVSGCSDCHRLCKLSLGSRFCHLAGLASRSARTLATSSEFMLADPVDPYQHTRCQRKLRQLDWICRLKSLAEKDKEDRISKGKRG